VQQNISTTGVAHTTIALVYQSVFTTSIAPGGKQETPPPHCPHEPNQPGITRFFKEQNKPQATEGAKQQNAQPGVADLVIADLVVTDLVVGDLVVGDPVVADHPVLMRLSHFGKSECLLGLHDLLRCEHDE